MSKIIVPLHFAKLTTTPGNVGTGFKKFYLKGEWFKLFDGISEIDVVLDRPLDNYVPIPGTITSSDTVLTAIEKLDYAVGNINPNVLWGSITGTLTAQTDLINYLSSTYVPYTGATASLNIGAYSFEASSAGYTSSLYAQSLDFYGPLGEYTSLNNAGLFINDPYGFSGLYAGSLGLNNAMIYRNVLTSEGFIIPDKGGAGGTFAMLSDIPSYTTPDLQAVTGAGANTNIPMYVRDVTFPSAIYTLYSKTGIYAYTASTQSTLNSSQLSFQRGGTIVNSILIDPAGGSRSCTFYIPNKPSGTYILATTDDIPLTQFVVDSYIGTRLKPSNTSGNGFYFERNANESVGYTALNTNIGNGAVAQNGVGTNSNSYIKNTLIVKFGDNYYLPLLAGKGGLFGTEEVFVGSSNGNDVSVLTGADYASLTRKFTVKADGQLQIQTTPATGTTSDYLLLRDSSGNVKQIVYPTIPSSTDFVPYIGATASVDLDAYDISAAGFITQTGGPGKKMTLRSNNVTVDHKAEWQDKDYTGIADITDIPTIQAGTNITIDNTDPLNPIINASGGGGILHATASGTDTYTATITGVTAYNDADAYLIRFTNGNTTSATLNINGLGAISLYRNNDGVLIGGDIISGGEMLCVYNSTTNRFQIIGTAPNMLLSYVTNDDSVTLTKGMAVYAFGGTGDRMTVKRANNTGDATSAQTVGLVLSTSIAANQKGLIMMQGLLDGLSILPTATFADGDAIYLGATDGSITNVKPYAPNHLVYLGVVTTASNGSAGRMYVKVQNGYELDELHNVQAQSPTLKDTLWYDNTVSPAQWKTASISTILGYTPQPLIDNFLLNRLPNTAYTTITNYVVAVQNTSFSSSATNSNNITRFVPFVLEETTDFDAFYIFQSNPNAGAGAYMTMYIYDDSNDGLPGIKLHQDSTAPGSLNITNVMHTFNGNITLQPGAYWMAFHIRNLDTAGVNPTFYFTQNTNFKSIQFTTPAHGSNQYIYIIVTATVGDLGNNPTLSTNVAGLPQTIFVKFKKQ